MSAIDFEDLKRHIGHKIVCVAYGRDFAKRGIVKKDIVNVSVECETCNEVLMDYDKEVN